jgi:MFS family permease
MALSLAWYFSRFGARRTLLVMLGLLPVALLAYALAPTLGFAAIVILGVGYLYMGCLSSFTTIAQLVAPPELRGRVVSVLMMLLGALYPLGAVLQGAIADEIGLRPTTAGAAILLGLSFGLRMVARAQCRRLAGGGRHQAERGCPIRVTQAGSEISPGDGSTSILGVNAPRMSARWKR